VRGKTDLFFRTEQIMRNEESNQNEFSIKIGNYLIRIARKFF